MTPGPGDATEAPVTVQLIPHIVSVVVLCFYFYYLFIYLLWKCLVI